MHEPQYRYNPKTLRYERVRFSIWRTLSSFIAYGCFGILFFIGLNIVQNVFIETEREKSLRAENNALSEYKVLLASQISSSNEALSQLQTDESDLHQKLFKVPATPVLPSIEASADAVTSSEDWDKSVSLIEKQYGRLMERTKSQNDFYSNRLHLKKNDMPELLDMPSIAPVKDFNDKNLVSGFGIRINPFHKGNYHHDGIDIALPKGTEILATGNGKVVSLTNFNRLEAGYGNYVEIDHGFGLVTRYAHLEQINVTWGQKISQGQVIGLSGSTGGSVAPHLHYEVIKYGKSLDPLTYIIEGISADRHQQLAVKSKKQNQSLD